VTLEAAISTLETQTRQPGEFKKLCEATLQTPEGQRLLAMLCTAANPVNQTFCADARLAAHLAGNREVVALLWRYGAASNSVPGIQPEPKP
jgi:hypothetical protein